MAKRRSSDLTIFMVRGQKGLVPQSALDEEMLERIPLNTPVSVDIHQHRSIAHHRGFFGALNNLVKSGATQFTDLDEFLKALKVACGVTDLCLQLNGEVRVYPSSISWDAMGEIRFKEFVRMARVEIGLNYGINLDDLWGPQKGKVS